MFVSVDSDPQYHVKVVMLYSVTEI